MLAILSQSDYKKEAYKLTDEQLQVLKKSKDEYIKGEGEVQLLEEFRAKMK